MPRRPPRARHFMAATALAKRSVHSKGHPRSSPTAQAPWKTSPAPLVSTTAYRESGGADDAPALQADRALRRQGHRHPRRAAAPRAREGPSSSPARPVTWATKPGLHARRSTPGHTWSMPSTTRSPSIVTRSPASRAHRTADRRGGRVDAVHVEEPARRDDRPVELFGPDVVGRRPAVEAGPEAGVSVDQHDADVARRCRAPGARAARRRRRARRSRRPSARPVVVAELADVARPEAEPRARHHRGRDHAAALHLELPHRRLGVRQPGGRR